VTPNIPQQFNPLSGLKKKKQKLSRPFEEISPLYYEVSQLKTPKKQEG
jgi:hypothetical protein